MGLQPMCELFSLQVFSPLSCSFYRVTKPAGTFCKGILTFFVQSLICPLAYIPTGFFFVVVVHLQASLVVPHLDQLLPLLYSQTAIREDMIRTVDLGPFKHKVGKG